MTPSLSERKVLVVDTEPSVCRVIGECLAEWPGTEVSCVTTGALAAQALQTARFDLVLIDAVVPGLPDLSLAQIAADKNIPVLIFSGHPGTIEKLDSIGCPCFAKPISLGDLIARAKHAVAGARENVERARRSTARLKATGQALTAPMALSRLAPATKTNVENQVACQ